MQQIVKALASITVWVLSIVGCLSFLIAPVARYYTREEFWLWLTLGISIIVLAIALVLIKLINVLE